VGCYFAILKEPVALNMDDKAEIPCKDAVLEHCPVGVVEFLVKQVNKVETSIILLRSTKLKPV
jgi:hypothetical protein